jgi:outer membrane protein assembly factor BamA
MMRARSICRLILLLALGVSSAVSAATAQTPRRAPTSVAAAPPTAPPNQGPRTFPLHALLLHGSGIYSGADALAASGLKLGQRVTQDELQQASNRLGSSGAFSTVSYQFMGLPNGGVDVTFEVRDNPQLVPIIFQNIVWLPRDQLLAAVRERVPLFRERVPLAGEMSDQIRAALEQVLAAKGVNAKVSEMTQGAIGSAPTAIEYSADNVNVRVASIDFTGRRAMDAILLENAVEPQRKESFIATATNAAIRNAVQDVYLARGYLTIKVGDPAVTLADPSPTSPAVKLLFPIEEGRQYNYAGSDWRGNTAFTAAELGAKLDLATGRPANLLRLRQNLDLARKLYGTKGYLAADLEAAPQPRDDGAATFLINVKEGPQYKMGALLLKGLAPDLEKKMRERWQLAPGAIYDDTYPARFVNETIGSLPPGIRFQFQESQRIDDQLRTVDVTIEYKRR